MIRWLANLWHKYAIMCAHSEMYDARVKQREAEIAEWNAKNRLAWHEKKLTEKGSG